MRWQYHDEKTLEQRKAECELVMGKYSGRYPVICQKGDKTDLPAMDKYKFLVPSDLTVGQFIYVIRKRIKLDSTKYIYLFVNDTMPPTIALMSSIYDKHKAEDGFLYFSYLGDNAFGAATS